MFTLVIFFTTLATKKKGMWTGASKQYPDLKLLPRRDRPPPHLKFLDPPLACNIQEISLLATLDPLCV